MNGTGADLTLDFTLNPAGQIASVTRSNDAYAYTGHANGNIPNTINGRNQVTQTGSTSVSHDTQGNVSAVGSASSGYTTDNMMASTPATFFAYDASAALLPIPTARCSITPAAS